MTAISRGTASKKKRGLKTAGNVGLVEGEITA